ncbi:MAG: hypothetical protein ACQESC_00035 [Nanobdellota archaeon]
MAKKRKKIELYLPSISLSKKQKSTLKTGAIVLASSIIVGASAYQIARHSLEDNVHQSVREDVQTEMNNKNTLIDIQYGIMDSLYTENTALEHDLSALEKGFTAQNNAVSYLLDNGIFKESKSSSIDSTLCGVSSKTPSTFASEYANSVLFSTPDSALTFDGSSYTTASDLFFNSLFTSTNETSCPPNSLQGHILENVLGVQTPSDDISDQTSSSRPLTPSKKSSSTGLSQSSNTSNDGTGTSSNYNSPATNNDRPEKQSQTTLEDSANEFSDYYESPNNYTSHSTPSPQYTTDEKSFAQHSFEQFDSAGCYDSFKDRKGGLFNHEKSSSPESSTTTTADSPQYQWCGGCDE